MIVMTEALFAVFLALMLALLAVIQWAIMRSCDGMRPYFFIPAYVVAACATSVLLAILTGGHQGQQERIWTIMLLVFYALLLVVPLFFVHQIDEATAKARVVPDD